MVLTTLRSIPTNRELLAARSHWREVLLALGANCREAAIGHVRVLLDERADGLLAVNASGYLRDAVSRAQVQDWHGSSQHALLEALATEAELGKLRTTVYGHQPTYAELFRYASIKFPHSVVALLNADVALRNTHRLDLQAFCDRKPGARMTSAHVRPPLALVLSTRKPSTRRDPKTCRPVVDRCSWAAWRKAHASAAAATNLPPGRSWDVTIFRAPLLSTADYSLLEVPSPSALSTWPDRWQHLLRPVYMNSNGAERRAVDFLLRAGYEVRNPCEVIHAEHFHCVPQKTHRPGNDSFKVEGHAPRVLPCAGGRGVRRNASAPHVCDHDLMLTDYYQPPMSLMKRFSEASESAWPHTPPVSTALPFNGTMRWHTQLKYNGLASVLRSCAAPSAAGLKEGLKVIAFSLFGPPADNNWQARYGDGAVSNARLATTVFVGWQVWMYHDDTVPRVILASLALMPHVRLVNMSAEIKFLPNPRSWRFLVASDPRVGRWLIRDIDSRLLARDKAAVDEWVTSGARFSIMRDHPGQTVYPINAGMWGGTRDAAPCLAQLMRQEAAGLQACNGCKVASNAYYNDQIFLQRHVWPVAHQSMLHHAAFGCSSFSNATRFGASRPFPTPRTCSEHIGAVYLNGRMRQNHVARLYDKDAKACGRPERRVDRAHQEAYGCDSCVSVVKKTMSTTLIACV